MKNKLETKANNVGNFLVRVFHYLALFAIGSAIVWSAFFAFLEMAKKTSASIEDILLLFIYLELGAVVGIYFKTNHMPVRFLIYVAITALTRMLLEYLNNWHNATPNSNFHYDILIICGGIVLLSISIIVLRYSSFNYPSDKK
ncbi:MAG: phosphate-starvation-inducible protein PsiE [Alphaproteobacteria bacterium TMED93]|nr:MAG: phosphate-starvation-inducible protein PsiE [Alphaproteobacteria bacterium TMED93]